MEDQSQNIQNQNQQLSTVPATKNSIELENLELSIFGDQTIKSFLNESVEEIKKVEREAYEMFLKIKEEIIIRNNDANSKIKIEDVILTGTIAKDFLLVLSNQSNNRTNIMKAVIDLIKVNQAQVQVNNIGSVEGFPSPELQKKLETIDPFEVRDSNKPKQIKRIVSDEEEDDDNSSFREKFSDKSISVIHSYKHKKKDDI